MSYPKECVDEFERWALAEGFSTEKSPRDDAEYADWQMNGMLEAFAHQWERCRRLEALIVHAWVHSAYHECGRSKMDSDERALFDDVIRRANDALDVEYPDTLEES